MPRLRFIDYLLAALVVILFLFVWVTPANAGDSIPRAALKHRADLTRAAHSQWGLDAPIAVFAAQLHQESAWKPEAVSYVGAKGMAQFMPATAKWWCEINNLTPLQCQPNNPKWAMRSLVGYDLWLYKRVRANDEFDKLWAALRSYNGGLGHWRKEAKIVRPALDRATVDSACGKARRSIKHCRENLGYPQRIMLKLQPRYLHWGGGVSPTPKPALKNGCAMGENLWEVSHG